MKERIELLVVPTLLITSFRDQGRLRTPPNLLRELGAIAASVVGRSGFGSIAMKNERQQWEVKIHPQELPEAVRGQYEAANNRFVNFLRNNGLEVVLIRE